MPKIAIVINSLSNGGAERTVSNITTHLPDNYDIDIILNDDSSINYDFRGNIISLKMKPKKNKLTLGYQFLAFERRIKKLRELKKQKKYDAVISFSESANIANILSGNRCSKTIVSVRVNLSSTSNNRIYRYIGFPLVKILYNLADIIVAVSEGVRQDLIDNFGIKEQKICTIPNGCDIKKIKELCNEELTTKEIDLDSIENIIITTGRLEYQKGQWHLIRALSKLKERDVNFKLFILGEGSERSYYEELVKRMKLDNEVIFLGFCNNPFAILAHAKLYVLPSLFEGMGNTLIEALACGIPCISTDHESGAREILAPETEIRFKNVNHVEYAEYGVLVPTFDGIKYSYDESITNEEILMENAIFEMLTNKKLNDEYRRKAQQRANDFELKSMIKKWMSLIESNMS
ncbi:Glycosyltransferase involved in cell wall bisynthesis [Pseudobutyrivibrio sp. UC1225]|uniref:glycosyltransferase n=1 Tax=Pseudobutyrivibrio sp. UC1225 TaxID=1798185 RepID=UPI0008F410DE|nr:glycosyltransferase [Pseudobutyrivibrio sp. UC1225]SFN78765.1 Glycosyltransferase involved in cell wall bisynthesis [Pseudobutyrivibrio sp. UC1225]